MRVRHTDAARHQRRARPTHNTTTHTNPTLVVATPSLIVMRASLLFACALVALIAVVDAAAYHKHSHTVTTNKQQDLMDLGSGHSIKSLRLACDALPSCVGFSSRGMLKGSVHETRKSHHSEHLYVKVQTNAPSNLWPAPQEFTSGTQTIQVAQPFTFTATEGSSSDLTNAFQRFQALIFPHRTSGQPAGGPTLSELQVKIANADVPLQLGVDESYVLNIPADGTPATLTANTYYGALRGLESFSQLVFFNFSGHGYAIGNGPWEITDAPRFQHRGVMIDTARHFEPVPTIKRVIDSISYAKFNTLHWHVVDSQSFPFESRTFPLLWKGAYSDQERYTQEDMADVVEYARERGIRVVIEFDTPGHAESWCAGYPDVCPSDTCLSPLDPSNENIFQLMTGVWSEVTGNQTSGGIFPDNYIHLGGDEVDTSCWSNTPRIQAWMDSKNFTTDDAYMYLVERAHDIVTAQGRHPINWEEVFLHFGSKLDKRTIIHIWLDHETLAKVVAAGYQGILSNQDVWYLDHLATPWTSFYLNEPYQGITVPEQQALVLGGEVCMWGETVDTSDIFNTIWPRAAAAAERLWSPADLVDTDAALIRLERFRCLLNSRGIDANPVLTTNGRDPPPGPGGCYVQ